MEMTRNSLLHLLNCPEKMGSGEDFPFHRIQLWSGETPEEGTLYLTREYREHLPEGVLYLKNMEQINLGLELHQRYLLWREQCLRFGYVEHDLATLLECSRAFLGWDMHIVSREYRADTVVMGQFRDNLPRGGDMSREDVERLYYDDPDFDKTFTTQGIQPYPQSIIPGFFLYFCNIFQEGLYLGRLLILVRENRRDPGALALMEQLSVDVAECYRFTFLRRRQGKQAYRFYDLWRGLLEGHMPEADGVREGLAQLGWEMEDTYQILYLMPVGYSYDPHTLKFYAVQMESAFPSCVVAEMGGGLYCLHNLTAERSPDFRQDLGEFLRENLFRAGISNPFRGFFDSPRYRQQAQEAMHLGQKKSPSLWRYDFCDYVSDYIRMKCLEYYPPRDLCPRNLRTLLEYEDAHPDSELVNTLYQYYTNQFNAQLAAQKLFIHRTTFFYRMNRIQSIAAFRPEDPEETAQILLAFQVLKQPGSASAT